MFFSRCVQGDLGKMRNVTWRGGARRACHDLLRSPSQDREPLRVSSCARQQSAHLLVPWPGPIPPTVSEDPLSIPALAVTTSGYKGGREREHLFCVFLVGGSKREGSWEGRLSKAVSGVCRICIYVVLSFTSVHFFENLNKNIPQEVSFHFRISMKSQVGRIGVFT